MGIGSARWIVLGAASRPLLERAEVFFSKEGALRYMERVRKFYVSALAEGVERVGRVDPEREPTWRERTAHPLAPRMQELGAVPVQQELWIARGGGREQAAFSLVLLEDPEGRAAYLLEADLHRP